MIRNLPRRRSIYHPTLGLVGAILLELPNLAGAAPVTLWRTPDRGIQPQAAIDTSGGIHLVYYQGDPRRGDLFYSRRLPEAQAFSEPIPVNSQNGSAIAVGTIRGAQLALGKGGRVHVVWNGSQGAPVATHPGSPLLYTRLNDRGTAFEPERDLIMHAAGLDGGSSVAADQNGNVYVTWHAREPNASEGEEGRAVFIRRSKDEGATFDPERPALRQATGVCACCGMRALADDSGAVYMLFRAASAMTNRDELLAVSRDFGAHFQVANKDRWISATCPMSSAFLSEATGGALAAWETADQVYYASIQAKTGLASPVIHPPGNTPRKHPVVVQNGQGEVLLVWTEGTGWEKGGSVVWQVFDHSGKPLPESGRADGVPVWSLATAVALKDGRFVVIY
jgi:hypothetical protein